MKCKMSMRNLLMFVILSSALITCTAGAGIIVPSIVRHSNTNHYSTASIDKVYDNSGMTPAVNSGDSLLSALDALHVYGGVFESWVTNASAPDYFAGFGGSNIPEIIWDLTGGGDTPVGTLVIWQYQNDGGDGIRVGNHVRTIEMQFNTEAEGSDTFEGDVTTVNAAPILNPPGINVAQPFALVDGAYRYVRMRITDNHFGDPDGLGVNPTIGGDRVGIGEVRFATEIYVPVEDIPKAWLPNPLDGATEVDTEVTLQWKTGRFVNPADANDPAPHPNLVNHVVYMSSGSPSDPNLVFLGEVAAGDPVAADAQFGPLSLERSRTYYWRVDEVTDSNTIVGNVWSFQTIPSDPSIDPGTPADQLVFTGQDAVFTVSATNPFTEDSSGLSYQWFKVDPAGDQDVGTDSATLTIPGVSENDEGQYYCVVTIVEPAAGTTAVSKTASLLIKRRIAYWPFDGNLQNIDDGTGSTDGSPVGDPNFAVGLVNAGQALDLDGDEYVTVNHDAIDWSPTGSFSVSLWANVSGGGYRAAISNRHEPPVQGFILYAQGNNQWGFWTGAGNWAGPGGVPVVSGEWTHLVITLEPTGSSGANVLATSTLYVNGIRERVVEQDVYLPKGSGLSDLFIGAGRNENPANFFFNGLIDDVRIYNYPLEHVEVAQLYTDVVGPACVFGNPPFDVTGPDGVPDCVVDFCDLAEFASHWLDHGFFPDRP